MKNISGILSEVTEALSSDLKQKAASILEKEYPFHLNEKYRQSYTQTTSLEVFLKDGFTDRYTGIKLVYPSVLYTIAYEVPEAFPYKGGRNQSHYAHWDLFPTVDHLIPVSRGGQDNEDNWVTTSMTTNMAKSSSTLEELGWRLHEPGNLADWDGLCSWYISYSKERPYLASLHNNKGWHNAIVRKFRVTNALHRIV